MVNDGTAVDRFLAAVEQGTMEECDAFDANAIVDATVPNWRMTVRGDVAIRGEFGRWYDSPGRFEEVSRTPTPFGELVTFTRSWEEDGVPHAVHQAHLLSLADGRIVGDQVWCGGRWPAELQAEMAAAGQG